MIEEGDELGLKEISISSPGKISLEGSGEVIKELREFIKDVTYRNRHEKRMAELEQIEKENDIESKKVLNRIEYLERITALCEKHGYSEDAIKQIIDKIMIPANKLMVIFEKQTVDIKA